MLVGNNLALVIWHGIGFAHQRWLFGVSGWQEATNPCWCCHTNADHHRCGVGAGRIHAKSLFHASPNVWLHVMAYPSLLLVAVLALPAWIVMILGKTAPSFVGGQVQVSVESLGVSDLDN